MSSRGKTTDLTGSRGSGKERASPLLSTVGFRHSVHSAADNSRVGIRSGAPRSGLGSWRGRRGSHAPCFRQVARERSSIRPVCRPRRRGRPSQPRMAVDVPTCRAHSTGQRNRRTQVRHPPRPRRRAQCPTTNKLRTLPSESSMCSCGIWPTSLPTFGVELSWPRRGSKSSNRTRAVRLGSSFRRA